MGYYTEFTLNIEPASDEIWDAVRNNKDIWPNIGTQSKWYDHERDLKAASIRFPDVVFHLRGEGEEPGDVWEKDFKNGKRQVRKAQIVIAPFDPDRWE